MVDGPFSDYVAFENPLEGNLVLTKSLDYETMRSFSLTIKAKDQGAPPMTSQTLVTINVMDAAQCFTYYNGIKGSSFSDT